MQYTRTGHRKAYEKLELGRRKYFMNKHAALLLAPVLALTFLGRAHSEDKAAEVSVKPNQVVVQVYGIV